MNHLLQAEKSNHQEFLAKITECAIGQDLNRNVLLYPFFDVITEKFF
jgi:hypothetical protein